MCCAQSVGATDWSTLLGIVLSQHGGGMRMVRKTTWLCFLFCCMLVLSGRLAQAADNTSKFRIFLTNDDGIRAEGLIALAKEIRTLDAEVTVVAPDQDRSGSSHALTSRDPFRVEEVRSEKGELFGAS